MNKKIIMILAILMTLSCSIVFLTGCSDAHTDKQQIEISVMGPNDYSDSSFYRVVKDNNGNSYAAIAKMDVETSLDTIVYEAEENRKISNAIECGDGIVFSLTRPDGNGNYLLMYLDANDKVRTLYEAKHEIIIKNISGKILFCASDGKQNEFHPDTLEVSSVDFDEIEKEMFFNAYDVSNKRRYIMQNGTEVVLEKTFEEADFAYEVDGKDYPVDCVSGEGFEYAQWGCLSDNDGILYGMMAIPEKTNNKRRINSGISLLGSDQITKELIFSIDVKSGKSDILYETSEDRIVGHTDKDVYLFKNGAVYKRNIESGNEEMIDEVPCEKDDKLVFRWIGSKLFVFEWGANTLITTMQG